MSVRTINYPEQMHITYVERGGREIGSISRRPDGFYAMTRGGHPLGRHDSFQRALDAIVGP